jgi:hypothetical protein
MTQDAASRYWDGWLQDPDRSERQLRNYTLTLVQAGHRAAQEPNLLLLQSILTTYLAGAKHFTAEPLISTYETGKFMLQLTIADSCVLNQRNAQSWELAEEVLGWLRTADQRRASAGLPVRPNSEIRVTALGVQALAFFEDQDLSSLATMKAKVREFWQVADVFWANLERPAASKDYRSSMHQLTAIYELEICKAALFLGTELAATAVHKFNRRHGQELEHPPAHFKELDARAAPTAFYWDYEYAKLVASRSGDEPDLLHCAQQRAKSARFRFGSAPLEVLDQYWRLQRLNRNP